jgi:hypothetical protein
VTKRNTKSSGPILLPASCDAGKNEFAMTWGGTQKILREIVTLETEDMPQKVFFGAFWIPLKAGGGGTLSKKKFENYIFKPAMGSCEIIFFGFLLKKKVSKAT